jgi:hypothetical protein
MAGKRLEGWHMKGLFVRKRDFLACGLRRTEYEKLVECGGVKPLPQTQGMARRTRHHLFPVEQLEQALRAFGR